LEFVSTLTQVIHKSLMFMDTFHLMSRSSRIENGMVGGKGNQNRG
jgi:hypothetical protein